MKNRNMFIVMILIIILFNSIVYSALNSEMFINGDAHIRVDKDIRITDVKVLEQTQGSYETYNSDYSKNTTSMQITLPSSESIMIYEVTITNKGDIDYEVTNIIEESYSNNNIKYELIDIEKGEVIDGGTTKTFKIKFTTTENNTDNKTTLVLKYNFKEWIPTLYNMVAHKSRSLDTDIDFSVVPTKETSGVYEMDSTKDLEYPVYYYRGIIDNNNVSFASFCWKIVRTTSTGGVKLIYNGIPGSDGSCNNTGEASQISKGPFNSNNTSQDDVSYVYDNGNDSGIKRSVDKWYLDNLVEYTEMLEDTEWCNDRSTYNISGSTIHFGAGGRNSSSLSIPSILCPNDNDKLTVESGKLKYPIALLTADEVTLAGHRWVDHVANGYLDINDYWWLLSPSSFYNGYAYVFCMFNTGMSKDGQVERVYGYRPSISLASGTMIKEGNGSVTNPYKLVEEKMPTEWSFDYTGEEQEFVVPYDGEYKIELWGASGTNWDNTPKRLGGRGAYTSGNIKLEKDNILYLYVGEEGKNWSANRAFGEYSFNGASGGSYACYDFNNGKGAYNYYGGSATDIRLIGGSWYNDLSINSRIMVAAGGASAGKNQDGGAGGSLIGYGTISATGATQTESGGPNKGGFGRAGFPSKDTTCHNNVRCGASSGYYGGGASNITGSNDNGNYGGGSGSSFISGHTGCVAITSENDQTPKTGCATGTTDNNCSIHYSSKFFTNTKMIDGAGYNWTNEKGEYIEMPTHDGLSTMIGNIGNGYAKITLVSKK